jgi:hypothetical protein
VGTDRVSCVISRAAAVLLAVVSAGCAGEPRVLPPREPPSRVAPTVPMPASAVPAGHGRVVLDAVDGPMRVVAKYDPSFVPPGGSAPATRSGELCVTPCVVDLPKGRYRLFMSATGGTDSATGDVDDLVLDEGTYVYRRAPGRYKTPSIYDGIAPAALMVVSITAMTIGGVMLSDADGRVVGGVLVGGGIAGTIGSGIWGYDASRAETQDGATTFFPLR